MKEVRFFYDSELSGELPEEEARHALRVLRLTEGDEIFLMDGKGTYARAVIAACSGHRCRYNIEERLPQQPQWRGHLHLAIAPTKLMDRMEWMVEKATEIGFDELTFLDTKNSERHVVKTDRIKKIVVSAVKQSHKAWCPIVNEMTPVMKFLAEERQGDKFICHCHEGEKPLLKDLLNSESDTTVLIGSEGDFSAEEVAFALQNGYKAVSLGKSRLRTETAGLVAVHLMEMFKELM